MPCTNVLVSIPAVMLCSLLAYLGGDHRILHIFYKRLYEYQVHACMAFSTANFNNLILKLMITLYNQQS